MNSKEKYIVEKAKNILAREQDVLEQQIALNTEIKLNLVNIREYGSYYQGALMMLHALMRDATITFTGEDKIHSEAILRLISQDKRHAEMFMDGAYEIHYVEPTVNKKGKLVSVKAKFAQRRVILEDID